MSATKQIESEYPLVMNAAIRRLVAAGRSLDEIEVEGKPNAWENCDFIALQTRKVCELVLLASTFAHLREGKARIDPKKWRPKDAFRELAEVNDNPLPYPIRIEFNKNGEGQHHIESLSKALPYKTLESIYRQCGGFLHTPTADRVLNGKPEKFDLERFKSWIRGFSSLIRQHVLFLPGLNIVLVCIWSGNPVEDARCLHLEAEGGAVFDAPHLPEFDLLVA